MEKIHLANEVPKHPSTAAFYVFMSKVADRTPINSCICNGYRFRSSVDPFNDRGGTDQNIQGSTIKELDLELGQCARHSTSVNANTTLDRSCCEPVIME